MIKVILMGPIHREAGFDLSGSLVQHKFIQMNQFRLQSKKMGYKSSMVPHKYPLGTLICILGLFGSRKLTISLYF